MTELEKAKRELDLITEKVDQLILRVNSIGSTSHPCPDASEPYVVNGYCENLGFQRRAKPTSPFLE